MSGDVGQLTQAIGNVLDNAIKFTPSGGTIALALATSEAHVLLAVSDTGIGIPADDLPGIFERFHRGRNTQGHPGNGLGLAITRAIVTQHHGEVDAVSSSAGTRVSVTLPVKPI